MSRPLVSPRLQWLQSRDKRPPDLGETASACVVVDDSHLAKLLQPGVQRARIGVARRLKCPERQRLAAQFPQQQPQCTVDDDLWADLTAHHRDEAILELLMLAGTYRTVSYLVNGLRLPPEPGAVRFPA